MLQLLIIQNQAIFAQRYCLCIKIHHRDTDMSVFFLPVAYQPQFFDDCSDF